MESFVPRGINRTPGERVPERFKPSTAPGQVAVTRQQRRRLRLLGGQPDEITHMLSSGKYHPLLRRMFRLVFRTYQNLRSGQFVADGAEVVDPFHRTQTPAFIHRDNPGKLSVVV